MLHMRLSDWSLLYDPTQPDLCFPPWQRGGLTWASRPHWSGTTAWRGPFSCSLDVTGRIYWNKGAEDFFAKFFDLCGVCCKVCSLPSHSHSQSLSPAIRPGADFHRPLVSNTIKAEQNVREIMAGEENTLPVLLTLIRQLERNCGGRLLSPGNFTGLTHTRSQENSGGQNQQ